MLTPQIICLSIYLCTFSSLIENVIGAGENLDGEAAMRSLESAQVKMKEKLDSVSNYIEQQLSQEKNDKVRFKRSSDDESKDKNKNRRKKKRKSNNPLMQLDMKKIMEMLGMMKSLEESFDKLLLAYEDVKNQKENTNSGDAFGDDDKDVADNQDDTNSKGSDEEPDESNSKGSDKEPDDTNLKGSDEEPDESNSKGSDEEPDNDDDKQGDNNKKDEDENTKESSSSEKGDNEDEGNGENDASEDDGDMNTESDIPLDGAMRKRRRKRRRMRH